MNLCPIFFCRRSFRSRRGMVLFEVMMALFIFTMVAFGLVIALNSSLDAAMDRNAAELATRGLQNQLVLLHAARVQPGDNDLPDDGSGVLYHLTVDQEQMQDQKNQLVPNMYRAVLTAKWKSHGQVEARTVSELIYQQ